MRGGRAVEAMGGGGGGGGGAGGEDGGGAFALLSTYGADGGADNFASGGVGDAGEQRSAAAAKRKRRRDAKRAQQQREQQQRRQRQQQQQEQQQQRQLVGDLAPDVAQRSMAMGSVGGGRCSGGSDGSPTSSTSSPTHGDGGEMGGMRSGAGGARNRLQRASTIAGAHVLLAQRSLMDYVASQLGYGSLPPKDTGLRERKTIYDTVIGIPLRLEQLIFFTCLRLLDSFLELFTVLPLRLALRSMQSPTSWTKSGVHPAQIFDALNASIVAMTTVTLYYADVSYLYHFIRGQELLKVYVVFVMLETFDRLLTSFGSDAMLAMHLRTMEVATPHKGVTEYARTLSLLLLDFSFAFGACILHSFTLFAQAIALNVTMNSGSNALLTMVISNNFGEIKSFVFKNYDERKLFPIAVGDAVERFHKFVALLWVLTETYRTRSLEDDDGIITYEWVPLFVRTIAVVFLIEVLCDVIKHAFLSKFNGIKPKVYRSFLTLVCKQTVNPHNQLIYSHLKFLPQVSAALFLRAVGHLVSDGRLLGTSLQYRFIEYVAGFLVLVGAKLALGWLLVVHAQWVVARDAGVAQSDAHSLESSPTKVTQGSEVKEGARAHAD